MQPPEPCDHKPRTDGWKRPGKTRPQPPPGLCGRHGPADLRFGPLVPQTLEPPERRFSRVSPSVCEASLWRPEGPYCPEENCRFSAHMPTPHLLPTAHSGPQAQSPHPPAPPCSGVRGLSTPGDPPTPTLHPSAWGGARLLAGRTGPAGLPPRLPSGSRHSPSRPALAFSVFHISSLKTSLKSPRVPHPVERKPQAPRGPGRPCRPPPGVGPSSSRCSADLGVRA